jgi:hypothetical protein
LGNCLPADVECGYYLCYGLPRDEHLVLPKDAGILCEITEEIVAGLKRPLNFIHMPARIAGMMFGVSSLVVAPPCPAQ